jgi:phosphoribosylanthranilate isomerase
MAGVKICGVKDEAALDAALAGGARYIGLVFFEKSPRNLSREIAQGLARRAQGRAETVAVTVNASDTELRALAETIRPDWIQLHGSENPARVAEARQFAAKGVIKAISVARSADLAETTAFEPVADMLLFDAKAPPGADRPGGNALAFDWTLLKGGRFARPWLLSGGLNPENVAEAIAQSGADLVDVSSGVESAPGLKDAARIQAFLAAAQAGPILRS